MSELKKAYDKAQALIASGAWTVTPEGRIRSTLHGKLIDHRIAAGYRTVRVWLNGKVWYLMAHRVVYRATNGRIPTGYVVHHVNSDRKDNHGANLRAVTPAENRLAALLAGRIPTKLQPEQVDELRLRWAAGETFSKLGADYGVKPRQASRIVRGESWSWRPWPPLLLPDVA